MAPSKYVAGSNDMVSGKSQESTRYYPEEVNRPNGTAIRGESPSKNHIGNWIDCIHNRKTPNAPVELGYRSAIAAHMCNLLHGRSAGLPSTRPWQPSGVLEVAFREC